MERNFYVYSLVRNDNWTPFYVGKGRNDRHKDHRRRLRSQRHSNTYLQRCVNKLWGNSSDFFECILVPNLTEEQSLDLEKQVIKYYKELGYRLCNLAAGGRGNTGGKRDLRGVKNPFYGRQHTVRAKCEMSKWKTANYGGNGNPFFGKSHSKKTKQRISESKEKKISEQDVTNICNMLKIGSHSMNDIAGKFGISRQLVGLINSGGRRGPDLEKIGIVSFPIRGE